MGGAETEQKENPALEEMGSGIFSRHHRRSHYPRNSLVGLGTIRCTPCRSEQRHQRKAQSVSPRPLKFQTLKAAAFDLPQKLPRWLMTYNLKGKEESVVMEDPRPLTCPGCETEMRLTRVTPALAGLPELRTYQCPDCKEVMTVPVQRGVPKS